MFVYVLLTLLVYVRNTLSGYIEKVEVSGCESCQLMLTCRQLDSIIVILDTDFKPDKRVIDIGPVKNKMGPFPPDHPRDALNKRCSGLNHCSFILAEDSPGSEAFGTGNITVKFACATRDRVHPYCNSRITLTDLVPTGILHNPGYPRFYAGQKRCVWKITAPEYYKVRLRLMDVALFDTREDCKDTLEIKDTGQTIYSTCTQEHPPSEVVSATESVEVVLTSRDLINPRRGILIYYTLVGCAPALSPKRGYLVFQNQSLSTYTCCKGHVFPDTRTPTRTIKCVNGAWNVSLPLLDCEKPQIPQVINLQEIGKRADSSMASEVLAPILLMVILFAINAIVVYYIHKARKKQIVEVKDEELGTFTETQQ